MALTIDDSFGTVDGCYYYDNKWEKLTLTGLQLDEVSTELKESLGEKTTGYFVLRWCFKKYDRSNESKIDVEEGQLKGNHMIFKFLGEVT